MVFARGFSVRMMKTLIGIVAVGFLLLGLTACETTSPKGMHVHPVNWAMSQWLSKDKITNQLKPDQTEDLPIRIDKGGLARKRDPSFIYITSHQPTRG